MCLTGWKYIAHLAHFNKRARDQTSPLYKAASNAFAGRLDFAEVHSSINALVEKYGVEVLPTLGVVSTADDQVRSFSLVGSSSLLATLI
jgi:hypothetical protein